MVVKKESNIVHKSGIAYENGIWKGMQTEFPKDSFKINEKLLKQLKKYSNYVAQVDGITEEEDTYANLMERSIRCALWMRKIGVGPGDVIGICTHNQLDTAVPLIASLFIGAICNPWWETCLDEDIIGYFIELTEPKVIFVNEESASLLQKVIKNNTSNIKIITLGNVTGLESLSDILKLQKLREINDFTCTSIEVPDHPALLIYTSGTTGTPKSVLLSYNTVNQMVGNHDSEISDRTTGIWLSSLCWISAIVSLLTAFLTGGRCIVYPNPNETITCQLIQKYQINWLMIGTGVANRLYKTKAALEGDFSSVKKLFFAGAIAKREIEEFLVKIFPEALVVQFYGCTETGGIVTVTPICSKPCSCGKVADNVQLKIINPDNGTILGVKEEGEICVKTSKMMISYYKNPKATAQALDSEGWYHTDDLGYYDEDGDLFIIDRIKDLIKCKLNDIAPGPIEKCIHEHPNIAEVAVVAKPYGTDREQPMAFVTTIPGKKVTEAEIMELVEKNLPPSMKLSGGIKVLDKMLYTASGKIAKKNLRDIARDSTQE